MTTTQRIIKYVSIAFAIYLIFNILSGITFGIISIGNVFDNKNDNYNNINLDDNLFVLDVEISKSNIIIKNGNKFKVESNNKNIDIKQNNNKLLITEKKKLWFNNSDLVIYIPTNYIFDNVTIENGSGKIDIETLKSKKLYFDLGAGNVNIDNLLVLNEGKIDGGAGSITINDGRVNNLDLDMGIGKLSLTTKITGNNEIDAGIGEIDLNLIGNENDYNIKLDKGIGSMYIDNKKINNSVNYGSGSNIIDINGGIGKIDVEFVGN
ncbi:MAG: DUF4097 domain-containing protein [Firmicutes bacterium]|nr:DUF4097 domain-containing protein [Bacillota bacterium]